MSEGDYWREQRRFALRNLKEFGFGKASMEDLIISEAKKLADALKKESGPVDLNQKIQISIVNTLWSIVVGENLGKC